MCRSQCGSKTTPGRRIH